MKVAQYYTALAIFSLALLSTVSSSTVEDRIKQLETKLSSAVSRIKRLENENSFLKTEVKALKYEDEQNKQKIDWLTNENKSIRTELNALKRDKTEDREEIQILMKYAESLKSGLGEVDVRLNRLDQHIQDIQSSCCYASETSTSETSTNEIQITSTTDSMMTTEPINDQIEFMNVDSIFSKVVPLKYKNHVATGYASGVKIYDLRTKQLVRSLDNSYVWDLKEFKENQLIQASMNGLIKIWDLEKGELQQTLSVESNSRVLSIALNKNQSLMLSGGWDANIILWDMIEFKLIRTFTGNNDTIMSVIFNEARNQVISGSYDQTISIWNIHDASLVRTLTGHHGSVYKLLLDEETGVLYSASADNTIKKWDIETGSLLATLTGHQNVVYGIILSEDKQRLVSSSIDRSIIIWDKHSNSKINQLNYTDSIYNLALNPLNGQLLSTSDDWKLLFWPFKP